MVKYIEALNFRVNFRVNRLLTCREGTPACHVGHSAQKTGILLRQADRLDVVTILNVSIENQNGHIVSIRLRCEAKVRVQLHVSDGEHLVRQRFNIRVQYIVTQGHSNVRWIVLRSGHAAGDAVTKIGNRLEKIGRFV